MFISADQLQSILQQQREQFEQLQQRLIEPLTKTLHLPSTSVTSSDKSTSVNSIAAAILDFHYEPSSGHTFDVWVKRWEDTFQRGVDHAGNSRGVSDDIQSNPAPQHTKQQVSRRDTDAPENPPPVDVIRPTPRLPSVQNRRMEQQFNRRHDATNRRFSLGQLVLANDYRDGVEMWTAGCILRRTGPITYDVEMQSSVWIRHANQLRPSFQPVTVPSSCHSIGCSPGYIRPTSRRFSCRSKSGDTPSKHLHGSFSKVSYAHADESSTTILQAINSRGRC
ncbi:hypothetical protein PHET_08037 [Paragonimus heterotremus]|uniref:Uncharacterized protein n=1 Tax=Paragonimus heterotremus TaxID=100268 RepID=A0A8J4SLY9_9TREM|nr:hypothetical protein PHET_08037 [Paragonimus heterotremus]